MATLIPNDIKKDIISDIEKLFNTVVEDDIIDFITDFQSKVTVEEGFAKRDTVRLYNLAVFQYNPKKIDSKTTMVRLLKKYDGDKIKALKEFKELGKSLNISNKKRKKFLRENRVVKLTNHAKIPSKCGKFSAR